MPIGPHIADIVSFPLRAVIDILPAEESAESARARKAKRAWLAERDYRVVEVAAHDIETDARGVLDRLADLFAEAPNRNAARLSV